MENEYSYIVSVPSDEMRGIIIRLVDAFDDEDGLNESVYYATYDLIFFTLGRPAAMFFSQNVEGQDGRYFTHQKMGRQLVEKFHAAYKP